MATKNLARTVIEGGRSRWSKNERRFANKSARRRVRQYARSLLFDAELGEGSSAPDRERVWRNHYDRLSAAERWLASFVGRPWNVARAEIARRFDTRTIAGQHIVFDHLLPSVKGGGHDTFGNCDFEVDEQGLLKRLPPRRYVSARKLPPGKVRRSPRQVDAWARGRLVGKRGQGWFWFEPTGLVWKACAALYCWRDHEEEGSVRIHEQPNGTFRQSHRLTAEDVLYFGELTEDAQKRLLFRLE